MKIFEVNKYVKR